MNIETVSRPYAFGHEFLSFRDVKNASRILYIRAAFHCDEFENVKLDVKTKNQPCVNAHVNEHFVACVELALLARAIAPQTHKPTANLTGLNAKCEDICEF